jgi:AcrR family transcriptional regulator
MPRQPDPHVEARILDAAQRLVHRGGENALSMRKVAAAAGTNTPAVYRRFRNKRDILIAITRRAQQAIFQVIEPCRTLLEISECVLEFALAHPREYQLLTSGLISRTADENPNVDFVVRRSAEWLGGQPKDHVRFVLALFALTHGTAVLLASNRLTEEYRAELRRGYKAAAESLITIAESQQRSNKRS